MSVAQSSVEIMPDAPFAVAATEATTRPRRTLKHGDTFILVDSHGDLGVAGTVLSVALPLAGFVVVLEALWAALMRNVGAFSLVLLLGTLAVLGLAIVLSQSGASLAWCLVVLALAPCVLVVGYETRGHRRQEALLTTMEQLA